MNSLLLMELFEKKSPNLKSYTMFFKFSKYLGHIVTNMVSSYN
jgi:hypothetical protein